MEAIEIDETEEIEEIEEVDSGNQKYYKPYPNIRCWNCNTQIAVCRVCEKNLKYPFYCVNGCITSVVRDEIKYNLDTHKFCKQWRFLSAVLHGNDRRVRRSKRLHKLMRMAERIEKD